MRSLYRRYRPLKLEDVVGQPQVTEPLLKSLKAGKISHAYLFVGPRGCGKTSVARILAHEVNGFKYEIEDDYVDIIEIDGASNRGIDNIRELREKVMIAPSSGKYKIYIIDEVHMLTKEAFNALLKTLEEPPKHTIFIMATTDAYKVPVTITSRAQVYTFKLASSEVMMDYLKSVVKKEKIKISDEALEIITKRGGGSFRDTLSLLDQLSTLSDGEITKDMVIAAMGLPQDEQISELLEAYITGDVVKITTILKDLLSSGVKPETLAEELIATIIADPKPELLPLLTKLPDVRAPYAEARLLTAFISCEGSRPAGPSPRAAGANSRAAALRNPPHQDINAPSPEKTYSDYRFDWNDFVHKVKELNEGVGAQLAKCRYEFMDGELNIYPSKKIVKTILSRDNNKKILIQAVDGNVKITIHDENDTPVNAKKDAVAERMSDIMGGEVQND